MEKGEGENSFQFIVITANTERKESMQKQFETLGENVNVYYLDASLPSNSQEYFEGIDNILGQNISSTFYKVKCCFLSHLRALEYASKSSCKFSVILEDDLAFRKEGFLDVIRGIFNNWHEYKQHKMVSIGYIPLNNYNYFLNKSSKFSKIYNNKTVIYNAIRSGTQGYIVKNDDIPYLDYLIQPTLVKKYEKLNSKEFIDILKNNDVSYNGKLIKFEINTPIDSFLNFLYKQILVFPPLVVERDVPSLISHNNKTYWDTYFEGYESEKDKYYLNL